MEGNERFEGTGYDVDDCSYARGYWDRVLGFAYSGYGEPDPDDYRSGWNNANMELIVESREITN